MNLATAGAAPRHTYVPAAPLPTGLPAPAALTKLQGDDDRVGPYVGRIKAPGGWNHSLLLLGTGYSAGTDFFAAVAAASKLVADFPPSNSGMAPHAAAVTQGRDGAFIVAPVNTFDPLGEKEVDLSATAGESFAAAASSGRPLLAIVDATRWAQTSAPRGESAIVQGSNGKAIVLGENGTVVGAQG